MKFTKEAALKIQDSHYHAWCIDHHLERCVLPEKVAIDVFDACQKAFEEERETIISGTDILISEIRGQLQNSVQLKLQAQEELKIAKRIVAQQQEQIAELRKELEDMSRRFRLAGMEIEHLRNQLRMQPSFPPPSAPNPGKGYRLLDPEKDEKRATDERAYKGEDPLFWTVVVPDGEFSEKCWYRRKIEPAPIEPDPLEALLPKIRAKGESSSEIIALLILIERELARTRKAHE